MGAFSSKFFNSIKDSVADVAARVLKLESKKPFKLTITLKSGNTATVDLTTYALAAVPKIDQVLTVNASNQVMFPVVTSVTPTALVVSGRRTRGTLALSTGPFENCAAGDVVTVWVSPV